MKQTHKIAFFGVFTGSTVYIPEHFSLPPDSSPAGRDEGGGVVREGSDGTGGG